jgi:hypothetical protein
MEFPVTRGLDVLFGFNLSWGFGFQKYYFLDDDGNRENHKPFTVTFSTTSQLGLRWRFIGVGSRFHVSVDAAYQLQYLNSSLGSVLGLDNEVPLGGSNLFHGPRGALSASF